MYFTLSYFRNIFGLECGKTPITYSLMNTKCQWRIVQNKTIYVHFILQNKVEEKLCIRILAAIDE